MLQQVAALVTIIPSKLLDLENSCCLSLSVFANPTIYLQKSYRRHGLILGYSYLTIPSSPAVTPVWSPTQTTLLIVPSWDTTPESYRKSGSASGRLRSNIRTFFSWPPVKRWDIWGDKATLRTMWLWGKEWRQFPEYVSQTFLCYTTSKVSYNGTRKNI